MDFAQRLNIFGHSLLCQKLTKNFADTSDKDPDDRIADVPVKKARYDEDTADIHDQVFAGIFLIGFDVNLKLR